MEISPKSIKAIEIFNSYKSEINEITSTVSGNIWKSKVIESILLYIGNGEIKKKFDETYFTKVVSSGPRTSGSHIILTSKKNYEFDVNQKAIFVHLIDNIVDHIKHNGVLESLEEKKSIAVNIPVKNNFLSYMRVPELLTWIGGAAVAVFLAGYYFGTQKVDRDFVEVKQEKLNLQGEVKRLNDTIKEIDSRNYINMTQLESQNKVLNIACNVLQEKLNNK